MLIVIIIFLSVICITFNHQNAKLRIQCKFYRECINCRKNGLWKDNFKQNLAINNFFGQLKRFEWVSYTDLDEKREVETESCFSYDVDFHYP